MKTLKIIYYLKDIKFETHVKLLPVIARIILQGIFTLACFALQLLHKKEM